MSAPTDSHLEIAHVLFIDIVAYSKLLIDQQTELVKELNEKVRDLLGVRAFRWNRGNICRGDVLNI